MIYFTYKSNSKTLSAIILKIFKMAKEEKKKKKKSYKYNEKTRNVRLKSSEFILKMLNEKPHSTLEIIKQIKKDLPSLCDDKIICNCSPSSKYPEWTHQVRWAVQDLKSKKLVEFNIKSKQYNIVIEKSISEK